MSATQMMKGNILNTLLTNTYSILSGMYHIALQNAKERSVGKIVIDEIVTQ